MASSFCFSVGALDAETLVVEVSHILFFSLAVFILLKRSRSRAGLTSVMSTKESPSTGDSCAVGAAPFRSAKFALALPEQALSAPSGVQAGAPPPDPLLAEVAALSAAGRDAEIIDLLSARVRAASRKIPSRASLQPSPACFRLAMQRLARSSSPRRLFDRLIKELCNAGLPPDMLTEACCIRYVCRRSGMQGIDEGLRGYSALLSLGYAPDLVTVECLASACLKAGRPAAVFDLVDSLEEHGVMPTAALYATLIAACSALGAVARGLVAFQRLRDQFFADAPALRLAFKCAISMCAQNRQPERALSLYAEGQRSGLELEFGLLAPVLASAVQANRSDLAVPLAFIAHKTGEAAEGSACAKVCQLLDQRPGSEAIMVQVRRALVGTACSCSFAKAGRMARGSMWDWGEKSVATGCCRKSCPLIAMRAWQLWQWLCSL